jgi:hypothetical protein
VTAGRWLALAGVVVALAAIVAGVVVIGTPGTQRDTRMDVRRERDLRAIAMQLERWHEREGRLPADLATLAAQPGLRLAIVDPLTGAPYEYAATATDRYRLCAVFATDTAQRRFGPDADDWIHAVGRGCFDRRIDVDDD